MRDSLNLTAALINPPGAVTGLVNATGCNIGVYYEGGHDAKLNGADVFGSNSLRIRFDRANRAVFIRASGWRAA
jgi:hypothetical protein